MTIDIMAKYPDDNDTIIIMIIIMIIIIMITSWPPVHCIISNAGSWHW